MTMDNVEIEQKLGRIRELASLAIQEFGPLTDFEFGLNRASVEWVEGFIERQRARRDPSEGVPEGLVNTLGAFLGECILAAAGGKWEWSEQRNDWSLIFASGTQALPFNKVWKQFKNGLEGGDSILGFYDVAVNVVAPDKLPKR